MRRTIVHLLYQPSIADCVHNVKSDSWYGLAVALELKFGANGVALLPELRQITDPGVLRRVAERIKTATSVDDLRQVYHKPADNG